MTLAGQGAPPFSSWGLHMIKKLVAAAVTVAALVLAFAPAASAAAECGIPQAVPGCTGGY